MATCSPHDPPDDEAVEQAAPSVIRLLSKAAALRTLDAKPEKVYHELWESYTWDELLEEIPESHGGREALRADHRRRRRGEGCVRRRVSSSRKGRVSPPPNNSAVLVFRNRFDPATEWTHELGAKVITSFHNAGFEVHDYSGADATPENFRAAVLTLNPLVILGFDHGCECDLYGELNGELYHLRTIRPQSI